jgi:hypothetical protein
MMLAREAKTQAHASTKIMFSGKSNKKSHTRSRRRVALRWKPEVILVRLNCTAFILKCGTEI